MKNKKNCWINPLLCVGLWIFFPVYLLVVIILGIFPMVHYAFWVWNDICKINSLSFKERNKKVKDIFGHFFFNELPKEKRCKECDQTLEEK